MSTPHNQANKGEIAKVVLMPGDPLRAKFIADTLLTDVVQFNTVRNMFGYTGTYAGKRVSVMGSGMGMPSIGIYSHELYTEYGVEEIIRIGSAGSYVEDLDIFDVMLVTEAFSESSYAKVLMDHRSPCIEPSEELNEVIRKTAKKLNIRLQEGTTHSSDVFYHKDNDYRLLVDAYGCKCVEMESFALFANAKLLNKKAACLLTISDSFVTTKETTPEERETKFTEMVIIALETAVKELTELEKTATPVKTEMEDIKSVNHAIDKIDPFY